jgi:hypothetical protein
MKKIILATLLVVIAFSAIAKRHKHKTKGQPANEIVSVALRHTACFGRCPDYIVEVNKDGMATYTGVRFTHDSGLFRKNIGKAKAMEIINKFNTYMADTCKDRYEQRIEDLPGLTLTIKYNTKTKMIQNANLGPIGLRTIAGSIDSLTRDKVDNTWHAVTTPDKMK